MKAVVCPKYGPPEVLQLREVETPIPKDREVLVRVHATTVSMGDCELRALRMPLSWRIISRIGFGFRGPRRKILGQELSGEVEATGKDVTLFSKGDKIFAFTGLHLGAYAEYDCLPETALMSRKPANVSFEQAATIPLGGLHAFWFLNRVGVQKGQKILIIGAGGGIGTYAIQLAKLAGAEVTAMDSTAKLEMLLSIGADKVVDYSKSDFAQSNEKYDIIFDVVGKNSFSGGMRLLKDDGFYLLGNPKLSHIIRGLWMSRRSGKRVIRWTGAYGKNDLNYLGQLMEAGKIHSVVDRSFPLEEIAEAHTYVDSGQKKGNVVINVRYTVS